MRDHSLINEKNTEKNQLAEKSFPLDMLLGRTLWMMGTMGPGVFSRKFLKDQFDQRAGTKPSTYRCLPEVGQ